MDTSTQGNLSHVRRSSEEGSSGSRQISPSESPTPQVSLGSSGAVQQLQCPVEGCFAVYVRRPRLVDHILTQHPEEAQKYVGGEVTRPFKCPVDRCSCAYVRKGDLKAHILKTHDHLSGAYPDLIKPKSTKAGKSFPCPINGCSCGYKRHSDLKYHFLAHHREYLHHYPEFGKVKKVEHCSYPGCHASFHDPNSLVTHMREVHNSVANNDYAPSLHSSKSESLPNYGMNNNVQGQSYNGSGFVAYYPPGYSPHHNQQQQFLPSFSVAPGSQMMLPPSHSLSKSEGYLSSSSQSSNDMRTHYLLPAPQYSGAASLGSQQQPLMHKGLPPSFFETPNVTHEQERSFFNDSRQHNSLHSQLVLPSPSFSALQSPQTSQLSHPPRHIHTLLSTQLPEESTHMPWTSIAAAAGSR